ncbi:MAG: TRAP transporter substrate-binding protein DctP [Nitrospinales bacterium]
MKKVFREPHTNPEYFFKKIFFRKTIGFALILLLLIGLGSIAHAGDKKYVIKFSTLAPEGSNWMKQLHALEQEIKKVTEGKVHFKFYPGGVSGDEFDVIRKMRIGQVHAAGFTGVGLGKILPEVRVLDLPFLFDNDPQVRHIYETMNDYFTAQFEKKGYVLLGWVPVGWVHFFSKTPIRSIGDLQKTKAWMWEGDPLVKEVYEILGVTPFPLSVTDVLLSLQTGMINTVYASPIGALVLQWFTKVKFMSQLRMGYATGAVLMTKKKFKTLPDEYQKILKEVSQKHLAILLRIIQEDNSKSIEVMKKNGLKLAPMPTTDEIKQFHELGAKTRKNLTGKLFSKELLDRVLSHLEEVK